ncbi:MAG: hypothetical protein HZY75_14520 [Nocardioidaceae bacterium]|nr:MAG: hypothetical protein HZY75_14520 [Nocardioidaceae bacterium]
MNTRPKDFTDLYLAPVAIRVDADLEELASESAKGLPLWIAMRTDREPSSVEDRRTLLIESLLHDTEMHNWELAWVPRGLELGHDGHRIVLGVPDNVRDYLFPAG